MGEREKDIKPLYLSNFIVHGSILHSSLSHEVIVDHPRYSTSEWGHKNWGQWGRLCMETRIGGSIFTWQSGGKHTSAADKQPMVICLTCIALKYRIGK